MRSLVKNLLLRRGMVLSRPPGQFDVWPVKLVAAKQRGLELRCVIDGGAADGGWAREVKQIYPDAVVVCVEPRADAQDDLRAFAAELGGVKIAQTLIGREEGQVEFHEAGPQSSALPNSRGEAFGKTSTSPMTTLDVLVKKLAVPWPDLIKLDLQGFELDALRGATQCLEHAQALLLELSFFPLQKGAPLAGDVICFLRDHAFRIYDIPGLWHRPLDGALAQGDFMFLKQGHPLLADNRWSSDSSFA